MIDLSAVAAALRLLAGIFAVLLLSYGGLVLMTSKDTATRNEWKEVITGVFIGLSLVFLAPMIATSLTGGGYCHA